MRETFSQMTADIMNHPKFQALRENCHHGGENSLFDHSVDTAICAYRLAHRFHLKEERIRAVTRAAMLHDFFGYDWRGDAHQRFVRRYSGWKRVMHMHAFIHGELAARRANRLFPLDERQQAAIASHMFPLAHMPRNSEAWILTLADKVVASKEMTATVGYHMKKLFRREAMAS